MRSPLLRSLLALPVLLAACGGCPGSKPAPSAPGKSPGRPGAEPVIVTMAYGSEKRTWLEEQLKLFAATSPRTASGRPIRVEAKAMGSGEAQQAVLSGSYRPTIYSPASGAYVSLLNEAWLREPGRTKPVSPAGEPLVLSPVVIAMWKPMAEALGWPEKQLGWADVLRVSAGDKGWGAFGHPEWGPFKLGHTHPEFSSSGLLSVLAEAYAGAKKTRGLTREDLASPGVGKLMSAVEASVVHYGKSTGFFADKLIERGPGYLSAAVLYENLVIESYARPSGNPPLVALYPVEGTFWADHPFCILDGDWVTAEQREGAGQLLGFLKKRPAQERALVHGFRPADTQIAIGAPVDAAHGADPKQPQTLLDVPEGATLLTLVEVWKQYKRPADVTLVFDTSGSMRGEPITQAKAGAKSFLDNLGKRDSVGLLFFDSQAYPVFGPFTLGEGKEKLQARVDQAFAKGGTALYDAVAQAYQLQKERARKDPRRIHALLVLTDGVDENSTRHTLPQLREILGHDEEGAGVKVFTIAYGAGADPKVLAEIAEAGRGTSARGTAANIVQVYQDMASFF
ncbi:MAG TPA: VWA domain-containing protein [Myxococcaceae bacterium]|nr:VWA domain-containing protein [Myxococcaceae bacterium]